MPQGLVLWGMLLKEFDFLLDLERDVLLRKTTRTIILPKSGRQDVAVFALVWNWYDRLISFEFGINEDKLKHFWQRCMDEEDLNASDALVRLVFENLEGYLRDGIDIIDHSVTLEIAQERTADWRNRKALR